MTAAVPAAAEVPAQPSRYHIDRQVLGILAAPLQRDIGWPEPQYGLIVTAFQAAYAIGLAGSGRIIDVAGSYVPVFILALIQVMIPAIQPVEVKANG
jgi:MFS family permease